MIGEMRTLVPGQRAHNIRWDEFPEKPVPGRVVEPHLRHAEGLRRRDVVVPVAADVHPVAALDAGHPLERAEEPRLGLVAAHPLRRDEQVERRREGCVDDGFYAMATPDIGEALEVNDAVIRVGRRFADERARGRADGLLDRLVIARRNHGDFDTVAVQDLGEKLPGAAVGVVCHDNMRSVRQHRE